jgi:hypothetical protein
VSAAELQGGLPASDGGDASPARVVEVTEVHTRLLRLALGVKESRAYWENVDPATPQAERAERAFDERWFGAKSLARVRTLLAYLAARYDAFPPALPVLKGWTGMTAEARQVIAHWHLQLSDPLYRRFTGVFLTERRMEGPHQLDRDVVLRWVSREFPDRWGGATCIQFASKLLSAASEAGLISPDRDPRSLLLPRVPERALSYLLYLLRGAAFDGTLLDNPYLASVGLTGADLDQRLRAAPGLTFRRMGALTDLAWSQPSLAAWALETR